MHQSLILREMKDTEAGHRRVRIIPIIGCLGLAVRVHMSRVTTRVARPMVILLLEALTMTINTGPHRVYVIPIIGRLGSAVRAHTSRITTRIARPTDIILALTIVMTIDIGVDLRRSSLEAPTDIVPVTVVGDLIRMTHLQLNILLGQAFPPVTMEKRPRRPP